MMEWNETDFHLYLPLFERVLWRDFAATRQHEMATKIRAIDEKEFLAKSNDEWVDSVVNEFSPSIPKVEFSDPEIEYGTVKTGMMHQIIDGKLDPPPREAIVAAFRYSGDAKLFSVMPRIKVIPRRYGYVVISDVIFELRTYFDTTNDETSAKTKERIEDWTKGVEAALQQLTVHSDDLRKTLVESATRIVADRRAELDKRLNHLQGMGFRLKTKSTSALTYVDQSIKRKVIHATPSATKPEPTISLEDYEHILKVMENMARVMEQCPDAFQSLQEEQLRYHFLVQLNGHFEGKAKAEAFNLKGKTDISMDLEDKSVFIGECKFWKGKKQFKETIDQALGYTTWLDTKVAVIVFNKNKNFSDVLEEMKRETLAHECCEGHLRQINERSETYAFHNPKDAQRKMRLTTMAFDIPSS